MGGPIVRDKLFFFGLFEYNPLGQASSPASATRTPTAQGYSLLGTVRAFRRGISVFLNSTLPPLRWRRPAPTVLGTQIPIGILSHQLP